jgi:hypothetical protein
MNLHNNLLTREHAHVLETRDAVPRPQTWNENERTIEAVVATGTAVTRRDARGEYDEVLDLTGGIGAIIGTVLDAWREGEQLITRLRLSSRPELSGIVADIRDGVIRGMSLGFEVTEWADGERNGRRTKTAVKWRPREVSFVGVPADPNARTRNLPRAGERGAINRSIRELCSRAGVAQRVTDDLIDRGATIEDARGIVLDELVTRGSVPIRASIGNDWNVPDATTRSIGEAIYARMTGAAPSERARPFMHRSAIDLMRDTLSANGVRLRDSSPAEVYRVAMQTRAAPGLHASSDFTTILGDNMGRRLGELFRAAESGVSAIAAPGTVRDFRPITEARLTSFPSLEPVNESGEIKWGTLDEEGEILAIASYARAIGVTFKVLVNDDLSAIDRSIRDIAFATATLKAKLLVAALAASLKDGDALFHANHDNLASSGAAPSETTLGAGFLAMAKQSPPGSTEPLGITPSLLLVPSELEVGARKLVATITPPTTEDVNVFAGRLSIAVEPRLPDGKQWFLFAAPGTYPVIRFLTLQGFEQPRFETNEEFTRLGTAYRVHWHVGAGPIDFRGAWKNPGQ